MARIHRRRWFPVAAMVLGVGLADCKPKPVPVEEVFSTRMVGLSYLRRNQLTEAETEFKKLITLAPDDPVGYADLGLVYLQAARYQDAEKQLERARELDTASTDIGLALAKVYALTNRPGDARALLQKLHRDSTTNAQVLYALASLDSAATDTAGLARYQSELRDVLGVAPSNVAVRLALVDAFVRAGAPDSAVRQLEEVRRIPPAPPAEARAYLDSTMQLLRGGKLADARAPLDQFSSLMQVTAPYQASVAQVKATEGPIPGRPVLTFAPKSLITMLGVRSRPAGEPVKLVDITDNSGLPEVQQRRTGAPAGTTSVVPVALAAGDADGNGTDEIFLSSPASGRNTAAHLYRMQAGFVRDVSGNSGLSLSGGATFATFADYDNDGWLDLFVIGGDGKGHLFHNKGNGSFEDVTAKAGVGDLKGARKALFVDLDHDGDLDLLLIGNGPRTAYRNNADGTFADATDAFGLSGSSDARDAVFADFDGDGRTDLFIVNANASNILFRNTGSAQTQRFMDASAVSGLGGVGNWGAVAVGDYNNDGFLDLFVAGANGAEPVLWLNNGNGTFRRDTRSGGALAAIRFMSATAAEFVDYDNDGWADLLVVGVPNGATKGTPGVFLFHNDGGGRFTDKSSLVPAAVRAAGGSNIVVTDIDDDGDEDFLISDASGATRLIRNDGGNSNLALNLELKALRTGSGKNNTFGIGSRVEVRAGEIYQTRVATGRVTHFGLGPHLKADVLRVEWPNGVPQLVYFPGTDQDVVEGEMLKGSCALAYTWDGKRFRFVTDAMWRSALGMPLGLLGSSAAFAPAGASQEYLRIPGEVLAPRDGKYVIQLTEELWETAYADEVKLIAVDHPDSIDVFVDEKFVPPGPVQLKLFQVGTPEIPLTAEDDKGNDVLDDLTDTDDIYVSNLTPTSYQGVVEPHDLVLDLGENAGKKGYYLFLRGWIYPTDASINVALSQQSTLKVAGPSLEVLDKRGHWKTAIANIGFPSGKDKTMVIDLAGKLPSKDHRVRIRTNMQIYWDQAFVGQDVKSSPVKMTTLSPVSADLHFRGFSRMYRKGGRYGPYWFDYSAVSNDSPWRPITGAYTRFGDVRALLERSDDMYVIMGAGDEATLEFDASSAASLPAGWKRDFLLYTDGWIKDSDLNTAFGTTVGPLPFHRIRSYPYAAGESYPTDAAHKRYLKEYNTRVVTSAGARAQRSLARAPDKSASTSR
jgi:VCBS repeat protein/tetratricopeptide repeat protein